MPDKHLFVSSAPAQSGDRRLALATAAVSVLIFLVLAPFARWQLPAVWPFIPIYESALAINDLITSTIIFVLFHTLRTRALLVLAAGYLFTALMAVPHMLTFPGLFSAAGLLGAGPQTTAWLYMLWHGGFPLAVIAYALLNEQTERTGSPVASPRLAILLGVLAACGAALALTLLATAGASTLPTIMSGNHHGATLIIVVSTVWMLSLLALIVLWRQRSHTVLDVWLMVVMCAWLLDIALSSVLNAGRFDLGFYAGRIYGLLAATFVLLVLLVETADLHARLAQMFAAERRDHRRDSEERDRIFETSLDLIVVVDRQGNLLRVSPSAIAILGYRPSEMVGRNAIDFVHPEDLEAIRAEMRGARRGSLIRNFATRYVHKNGQVITLQWSGVWSEPEQRHFFIGRDITEQKRVERMKDEFIATVSHELRTPVTSIAGPIGLLAGGAAGDLPSPVKRLVAMAQSNSKRLIRIVNEMLDIENITSGRVPIEFEPVDVKLVVGEAIAANQALANEFGVAVRLAPEAAEAVAYSDCDRLAQVVENLLSNAVKFSKAGDGVVVAIEGRGELVRISVRDYGPGVPKECRDLIFEKFFQVDATDARQKGGAGLGLSIVKETMARLGGSVGYDAPFNGGSIFHVDVPRWRPTARNGEGIRAVHASVQPVS